MCCIGSIDIPKSTEGDQRNKSLCTSLRKQVMELAPHFDAGWAHGNKEDCQQNFE